MALTIDEHVELNFLVEGSGEPIWLLFNGATLPLEFWDPIAQALAQTSTVLRFDQRNAGDTNATGAFSLNDTAADAAALLDHAGFERAIVVGHAWGGRAVQVFARDYPHRVRGLVICGTGGQLPASVSEDALRRLRRAGKSRDRVGWEAALAEAYCAAGYPERDRDGFSEITDLLWAKPPNTKASWDARISPSDSYWGMADAPTLLLYGTEDKNGTPENARDLARRLSDARLVFIESAGHFVVREAQQRVTEELLAFAAQLDESVGSVDVPLG